MMQLNIDRDHDGTWCWSVWQCPHDLNWPVEQRRVMRAQGKNYHTQTEAIAEGVHALLTYGIRSKRQY